MEEMKHIEAFTVLGFGLIVMAFTIGELIVTWRRELKKERCNIC